MKIFNIFVIVVFMAVFLTTEIHAQQQKKKTIAVLNFVNAGGVDQNEISILTDRFNNYLVNTEVYDVLEREKMDAILKEQDFTMTDNCNSSECAVQVGQLLGMEYMIAGKIGKFGTMYTLDIRMIDVSTGKILRTKSENYEGKKEGLLDMIESMAYAISGKSPPVKKTTIEDDSDEIKIGTVTKKFGSLEINCEMNGTLYINEKQIGEVTKGSIIPIDKLKVGTYTIKIIGSDGEFEQSVTIEFNRKTSITVKPDAIQELAKNMVLIKGGIFEMGDIWGDGREDEKPVHKVTVSDFYMSKYEVTLGMFKQFIDETGYKTDGDEDGGSYIWDLEEWKKTAGVNWKCDAEGKVRSSSEYNHPVIHVSWNDAKAFCEWISRKTGKKYRLPYEAEWEYAAREGGKKEFKYSGSNNPDEVAWYVRNTGGRTQPVGTKKPNALGLYDMSGNVWEWCEDWYDENYYKNSPSVNPIGPSSGTYRVLRGGLWDYEPLDLRVSGRGKVRPEGRCSFLGFRLVSK